jgi:hypothetical protein
VSLQKTILSVPLVKRKKKTYILQSKLTQKTIDPSEARVYVPDQRFDSLCDIYQPKKITPAHVKKKKEYDSIYIVLTHKK